MTTRGSTMGKTRLAAALGVFVLALAGERSAAACGWVTNSMNSSWSDLHCWPAAFSSGCVEVYNDACNGRYGCLSGVSFGLTYGVRAGTHYVVNLGGQGAKHRFCYGQFIAFTSCKRTDTGDSVDCWQVLSRSVDKASGGYSSPCNGKCSTGGLFGGCY